MVLQAQIQLHGRILWSENPKFCVSIVILVTIQLSIRMVCRSTLYFTEKHRAPQIYCEGKEEVSSSRFDDSVYLVLELGELVLMHELNSLFFN